MSARRRLREATVLSAFGGIADHLRLAEQVVVGAIRTWRDRRDLVDPGGARWIVEARHPACRESCSSVRIPPDAAAVTVIVPTRRACRALADFVRSCGLFAVDACVPTPVPSSYGFGTAPPVASGSARLRLRTRSSLPPRPLVPVELTVRSLLEHYRQSLGGDEVAAREDSANDQLRELSTLLEQAECAGERFETSRVLDDCERRIEGAFTDAVAERGTQEPANPRPEAFMACVRDLLRSAISADPVDATSALSELRLVLDSLPEDREAERRALGSAIGQLELRRATFASARDDRYRT